MTEETSKITAKAEVKQKQFRAEMPKLPDDFRGAQYANRVSISASAQEIFLDLFQAGPEAGGRGDARVLFVGRFILPLPLAKTVISRLQRLVESIEKDTGVALPGSEEMV